MCWRRLSHFVRSYIYRTNLVGSAELINAALKANVSCFVFTSSIAVYGAGAGALSEQCTRAVVHRLRLRRF